VDQPGDLFGVAEHPDQFGALFDGLQPQAIPKSQATFIWVVTPALALLQAAATVGGQAGGRRQPAGLS
jgi:hypothetical protein